jgi:methylmalonyl-CoA mutase
MDSMYQRGRIQDESLLYESRKHDGSLPLIGVNTFLPRSGRQEETAGLELMRSTDAEKRAQVDALRRFHARHAEAAPAALQRLQRVASARGNVFEELLDTVKVASLGQITAALYAVGGEYRRNM